VSDVLYLPGSFPSSLCPIKVGVKAHYCQIVLFGRDVWISIVKVESVFPGCLANVRHSSRPETHQPDTALDQQVIHRPEQHVLHFSAQQDNPY
jgi:hypothetical protein